MADIDFEAVGNEFLDGFREAAEPHLGKLEDMADEDKQFFADEAKLSADLLKDMAKAIADDDASMQETIKEAMEQHASTIKLRIVRRRIVASETANAAVGDAIEAGLRIALKIGLALLTGGLAL
jgi:phage-related protein